MKKFYDKGSTFGVTFGKDEVRDFKRSWPASGLGSGPYYFEFEKSNGDLIDLSGPGARTYADGPALLAMSEDAQKWGEKRLAKGAKKGSRFGS